MNLLLLGASHRIADADRRGRLALSPEQAHRHLGGVGPASPIRELVVLSTCNRVEIYAVADDLEGAERAIRTAVIAQSGDDLLAPGPQRYRLVGRAAAEHLCRVACSLESMLVGEAEILGQLKRAVASARAVGTVGSTLDAVSSAALEAGRRARTETAIAMGAVSVAGAGVAIAERTLRTLRGRSALVIGAGHAGRLALGRLRKRRPSRLVLVNRTMEGAREVASRAGAELVGLDQLETVLGQVDVAIAAVQAPEPVVTADGLSRVLGRVNRAGRLLVLVDLSVPPAIEAAAAGLSGVKRFGVDDLREIQDASAARRRQEIPRVEAIVREAVDALPDGIPARFQADEPRRAILSSK